MAESGEWNRKGATLSDVTAQKEYGVTRDFIVKGVRTGKLECREGSTHFPRLRWENEVRLQANKYDEAALASCEVCT